MTEGAARENKSLRLKGKYAVVTGGSRGLGFAIAEHFVREGASVAICARTASAVADAARRLKRIARGGAKVFSQPADVGDEDQADNFCRHVCEVFPRVDILVNCAGIAGPRGRVDEADWEEWKQAIQINLLGAVYVTRLLLPLMRRQGGGKILNISGGGATKPTPYLSAYAASKAAIVRFTETLAEEVRADHIDVNAIAPGVLATRMTEQILELDDDILGPGYVQEVERQRKNPRPALNRAAGLCVFLASSESDGITGKLISAVWDPWPELARHRDDLASTDIYTLRRITPKERNMAWG